jgi:hypothetical protein
LQARRIVTGTIAILALTPHQFAADGERVSLIASPGCSEI